MAISRVEKPKANEVTFNSKRKKSKESSPRKITNFKNKRRTRACTRSLPASGVRTQRTPQPKRKKFSAMKPPPKRKAHGSKILNGLRLTKRIASRVACHNSMRKTPLITFQLQSV